MFALTITCLLLLTCQGAPDALQRVLQTGKLSVVTRNAATTYYLGAEGPTGPEYELASRFAQELGVQLDLIPMASFSNLLPQVMHKSADFAAAHITVTPARAEQLRFGPPYQEVAQVVVYRVNSRRPRKVQDLLDRKVGVIANSSHVETLLALRERYPELAWEPADDASIDNLFERVSNKTLDFVVTDSTTFLINRRFYPEVRLGFELKSADRIAWAFHRDYDHSLYNEAQSFFARLRMSGELDVILNRYYEHTDKFDYVGTRTFLRHINARLPKHRRSFEEAAFQTDIDWQLLAAISYQESHWNPKAVSPTGVRGMMMLTQATARQLGVKDRTQPREAIHGGARYFAQVKARIPARITEPDRTWLALAAYNVGYGHLEDARILAARSGRSPDSWRDVREFLPLLSQEKWYSQVRHGYARGREPVLYVRNIRSYYDILAWKVPAFEPNPTQQIPIEGKFADATPAPER